MSTAVVDAAVSAKPAYTKKDFESGLDVRWCPGCGDYAILAQMQRLLVELGLPRENIAIISGIGCSSRFPYYMNTYGFHTIHGRAPAIATGLKCVNPDLSIWVITGDGDALSIGGNHLIHLLRRNLDISVLLFNNRIYGLTKGQYSPTSERGKVSASTPMGSLDQPFNPVSLAVGAEATFVARTLDRDLHHLLDTLEKAYKHKGTSFIEIYQNCNIFNDGAYLQYTDKSTKPETTVYLEHGQPLLYGKDKQKGVRLNGFQLESVDLDGSTPEEQGVLVMDAHCDDMTLALILSRMGSDGRLPIPLGVFRDVQRPCYEDGLTEQIQAATEKQGRGDLDELLAQGETWVVDGTS